MLLQSSLGILRLLSGLKISCFLPGFISLFSNQVRNKFREPLRNCIEQATGTTGTALHDILRYLETKPAKLIFLENVWNLTLDKSDFGSLQDSLHVLGYEMAFFRDNACESGLPQNRVRLWGVGVFAGKHIPRSLVVDWRQRIEVVHDHLRITTIPLHAALLPQTSHLLPKMLMELEKNSRQPAKGKQTQIRRSGLQSAAGSKAVRKHAFKWPSAHARRFAAFGFSYPRPANLAALRYLSQQQSEILELHNVQLTPLKVCHQVSELSQSLMLSSRRVGVTPCIFPKSVLWLTGPGVQWPGRPIHGSEALVLQGLSFKQSLMLIENGFRHRDLMDLAGNAFNAGSCLRATLAVLCTVDLHAVLSQ